MGHIKNIQRAKAFISVKEIGNRIHMFVSLQGGTGSYGKRVFMNFNYASVSVSANQCLINHIPLLSK
jgi:hypothetical protein